MFCFLENCDNNLSAIDGLDKGDCILKHLAVITKEFAKLSEHYKAMKVKTETVIRERDQFKHKLSKKQKEIRELQQKLKTSKRKNLTSAAQENVLQTISSQSSSSSPSKKLFKFKEKKNGKENSPKTSRSPNISAALTFSRLGNSFKVKASSPKVLKQAKLPFTKTIEELKDEVPVTDDDLTFCEELEEPKAKKSGGWLCKARTDKPFKMKQPEDSVRRTATDTKLFAFQKPANKTSPVKADEEFKDIDETPDISQLLKKTIKLEKSARELDSDLDIFSDHESSRGSSVMYVEPDSEANHAITIPDHTASVNKSILSSLENAFNNLSEFEDPTLAPPIVSRKRRVVYGECLDCREFYDLHGEAVEGGLIRTCPKRCKAYLILKQRFEPPQLPPNPQPIAHDSGYTPEGFWNLEFTRDDDPDRTQDGL